MNVIPLIISCAIVLQLLAALLAIRLMIAIGNPTGGYLMLVAASLASSILLVLGVFRVTKSMKKAARQQEELAARLKVALPNGKTLRGILPICASCKKIRDDKGDWIQMEMFIRQHSEADFSHGLCQECLKRIYQSDLVEATCRTGVFPES